MGKRKKQAITRVSRVDVSNMLAAGRLHERTPREAELVHIVGILKRRLGVSTPAFLVPKPVPGARAKNCWVNVKQYLKANGGEPWPGWLVLCQSEMYYLKCIPHIVVKLGELLLDVTPPERNEHILFIADKTVTVETKGPIIGLSKKPKARRVIAAAAQIAAFEEASLRQHNDNSEPEYANLSVDELPYDLNVLIQRGVPPAEAQRREPESSGP